MSSLTTGSVVFACVFGAALLGMRLRTVLPEHHLSPDTKDSVRLGMGLVATVAALVLGLLIASTQSAFETEKNQVTQMAAKVVFLDRVLAMYGPETAESRDLLRRTVEHVIARMWSGKKSQLAQLDPGAVGAEVVYRSIQKLSPQNDTQRALKSQAQEIVMEIGQARWLLFEEVGTAISTPLLVVVIFWLAIIFGSFGLFAPPNATVIAALLVAALSVAGAIFLILELAYPFDGLIQISSEPMRAALRHLGH